MIDTDKYKGHTPAPWQAVLNDTDGHMDVVIAEGDEKREAVLSLPCWVCEEDMLELTANAQLIADAPLLLQEVKRLRLDLASGRITTIVNPNDDHNRTLYVTIEFPDGEVYRGYVEKEGEEE